MPIEPGLRFGAYEIVESIGAGGMGEVYKARDTRLDRIVAVKFLSDRAPQRQDSVDRFEREARAISRLNHPHICTLHDVGKQDGVAYLVMEYVEGEALAERLTTGPLPLPDVLRYGAQIADALDAAHQQGIVHRDLKPANIMLTRGGAKLLDFGVAKLRNPDPSRDLTATHSALTDVTEVAGTLAYMAPEQLQGRSVDGRADLFALGVVLYEMASGKRPFAGDSQATLISAILRDEPAALPTRGTSTSVAFERALSRCLAKDPDERWQTARDLGAELRWILDQRGGAPARPASWASPRYLGWLFAPLAVVAGVFLWSSLRAGPELQLHGLRLLSNSGVADRSATFSPDGRMIAYASEDASGVQQIWVRNLAGGNPIQITRGDAPASRPRWSPTNESIVFARAGLGIWSVPPLGGPPRQIVEKGTNPDLSGDGGRLVFEHDREIWMANADGTDAHRVEGVPRPFYFATLQPAISPDSRFVAFFLSELGPNGDLWVIPAVGGEARRLTSDVREGGTPAWTPDGTAIIYSSARAGSRTLWRVPLAGGPPTPVTTGAGEDSEPAISADGRRLVYTTARSTWSLRSFVPDTGEERELLQRRMDVLFPRISPDGSRVAFFGRDTVGGVQIFSTTDDGRDVKEVTTDRDEINSMPRWSGDSRFIYYYRNRPTNSFRRIPADGGASVEIAPWTWEVQFGAEVDPHGNTAAYLLYQQGNNPQRGLIRDLATGRERALPVALRNPRWSRDGSLLAGDRDGAIYVCAMPFADRCEELTDGLRPTFSSDAARLYFLRRTSPTMADLWLLDRAAKQERRLRSLGPFRPFDVFFDVGPMDQIVWAQYEEGRHEIWVAELK